MKCPAAGGAAGRFRTSGTKGGASVLPVITTTARGGIGSAHIYENALPI